MRCLIMEGAQPDPQAAQRCDLCASARRGGGPWGRWPHNESTVINFINTQILNTCLREGWHLAHAAAVTDGARARWLISGLSGGGKSTSILRLMDLSPALQFLSNDRVLIKGGAPGAVRSAFPKHPRINPGTILGNPRLCTA